MTLSEIETLNKESIHNLRQREWISKNAQLNLIIISRNGRVSTYRGVMKLLSTAYEQGVTTHGFLMSQDVSLLCETCNQTLTIHCPPNLPIDSESPAHRLATNTKYNAKYS